MHRCRVARTENAPKGRVSPRCFAASNCSTRQAGTTLEIGDLLCVIGHEHNLPALGKLFNQPPTRGLDLRASSVTSCLKATPIWSAVSALYGLKLDGIDPNLPLSSFIAQKVGGAHVVGGQVEWNNTIWTVAVMDGNKIAKVG